MSQNKPNAYEVHPSIPCSRNLRRRTGVWMGVEAMELLWIGCLSLLPDLLRRVGVFEKPHLLAGVLLSATAFGFVVLFKLNKQPNYFTIWIRHRFLHPEGWRAPKSRKNGEFPILEDSLS